MFKSYEMREFGEYLRKQRKSKGITQKEVEEIAGISSETLRKIESGRVIPRYDTIIILSRAYRSDLMKVFMALSTSNELLEFYSYIDEILFGFEEQKLEELIKHFYEKVDKNLKENLVYYYELDQMILLIEGLQIYYFKENEDFGFSKFISAIRCSIPNFEIDSVHENYYTQLEVRLLILLSLSLQKNNKFEQAELALNIAYTQIKDCCLDMNDKLLLIKLFFNLSYIHHNLDNHENALLYAEDGIQYCISNHLNYLLPGLYYRYGIAKFYLKRMDYLEDLRHSINLLNALRKESLANRYKEITFETYNIKI